MERTRTEYVDPESVAQTLALQNNIDFETCDYRFGIGGVELVQTVEGYFEDSWDFDTEALYESVQMHVMAEGQWEISDVTPSRSMRFPPEGCGSENLLVVELKKPKRILTNKDDTLPITKIDSGEVKKPNSRFAPAEFFAGVGCFVIMLAVPDPAVMSTLFFTGVFLLSDGMRRLT